MKILLFCHLGQIEEYAEYINAFNRAGSVRSVLLTMGEDEYELGKKVGAFDAVKNLLPDESGLDAAELREAEVSQALRDLETRLGSNFVLRDILVDRFFRGQPSANIGSESVPLIWTGGRAKGFMHLIATRLEKEMDEFGPDFMFVETSFAPTRMAWRLARAKGIPAGAFMSVRFWPERLYLETGIGYDWHEARDAYRELPERPMTALELAKVKERLETVRQEKTKPAYLQTEHAKGVPSFFKKVSMMKTFSGHGSWLGKRARTYTTNPWVLPKNVFSPIAKYRRYKRGLKAKRYLKEHQRALGEIQGRKYAVYFLHVQPEITVEGMAFDYQDQVSTLRNILAALPADMDLVVKEHSPMLGYRPLDFYSQLVHMPGLIISDTREDSHALISGAAVVVTLTGTVALEAVMYGVPAIVLGSIYFDGFNGVYRPESLKELRDMLADPEKLVGATDEDALRALGSLLRASDSGRPPRVDVSVEGIDTESAKAMMAKLENLCARDCCDT
jgi:hypothetical protein